MSGLQQHDLIMSQLCGSQVWAGVTGFKKAKIKVSADWVLLGDSGKNLLPSTFRLLPKSSALCPGWAAQLVGASSCTSKKFVVWIPGQGTYLGCSRGAYGEDGGGGVEQETDGCLFLTSMFLSLKSISISPGEDLKNIQFLVVINQRVPFPC